MHLRRHVLVPVLLCLFASAPAHAQRWQVDLGATRIRYDTATTVNSVIIAPSVEWSRPTIYALLSGGLAAFETADWTAQARGDFSYVTPSPRGVPLRLELAGSAGGSLHSSGYRTGTTRGELRVHIGGRAFGAWAGGAAATGWTSASAGIGSGLGATAGAWGRYRGWNASVLFNPMYIEDYWFPEVSGRVSASQGPIDLLVYGGWRDAPVASTVEPVTWGGGTIALWLSPQLAFTVAGGTYPSDLLQSLPRGRYLSASIRISSRRPSVWSVPTTGRALYAAERGVNELRFRVPRASRVALVGSWTAWQPVPLERAADGRWVLRVTLGPGTYRFNLVIDGERWIVPDGVAAVDDGFGGKTGLLVVP